MMGAELAYLCAKAGKEVVLKDLSSEALDRGMAQCNTLIDKHSRGDQDRAQIWRDRITPSLDLNDVKGSHLVIEAVFEDLKLKHRIIQEIEPLLDEEAIFASNTSALPISDLAQVSIRPQNMIGLHFFSPVSKMPLVEIIETDQTSLATLQQSWTLCRAIKKTPIIVGDGYGFYTTRVFASYILEAVQCVA
jgi:3-hydroxyacyl-CoA dehydrogenase/enoyl-CoA hydratase/3-hydroxybutyryl-CoA epimerase